MVGLRRREAEPPDADALRDLRFAVIGILERNADDGLADFRPPASPGRGVGAGTYPGDP